MVNLQGLLGSREFWFFYHPNEEDYRLDDSFVSRYAEPSREGEGFDPLVIRFDCGKRFALDIEVELDYYTINLLLADQEADVLHQLGWWDEARWHPFALRWEELESLLLYWGDDPQRSPGPDASLLLLASFVGTGVDQVDLLRERRAKVATAYHRLGLFTSDEVDELISATLFKPPDDDYRWSRDSELGWVFSGSYPCYSIRNREHAGGEEGQFPFAELEQLLLGL